MEMQDIHKAIVSLVTSYEEINDCWGDDPCRTDINQTFRQEEYRDFYKAHNNTDFEHLILSIISNSMEKTILSRLQASIENNIGIYKNRKDDFNKMDFKALFESAKSGMFDDRSELLLSEKNIIQESEYPTEEEKQILLEENRAERNKLEAEKVNFRITDEWLRCDYYLKIYELSISFLSIINIYFPTDKKSITTTDNLTNTAIYFDMNLVSAVHKVCNDMQFKNLSELDLYSNLNNMPCNTTLEIKAGEKLRACYLIHKLYEYLKLENKTNWRNYILQLLDIKESLYNSKYKECTSEWASSESRDFVKRINRIFLNTATK